MGERELHYVVTHQFTSPHSVFKSRLNALYSWFCDRILSESKACVTAGQSYDCLDAFKCVLSCLELLSFKFNP